MNMTEKLLPKVKANLILEHNVDDELIRGYIRAALDYAKSYQHRKTMRTLTATTEQAVIMLATHFYESRDGCTGGFFADNVAAGRVVWEAVNRLLTMNKNWEV